MNHHDPLDLFCSSLLHSITPVLLSAASEPSPTLPLATYISFPQTSSSPVDILKDTPTRYTSKAGSTDEFYNLGQLWLAWTERESGVREYLIKGQATGVGYVSVADRRGVVEYLTGEGDSGGRVLGKGEDAGESSHPAYHRIMIDDEVLCSHSSSYDSRVHHCRVPAFRPRLGRRCGTVQTDCTGKEKVRGGCSRPRILQEGEIGFCHLSSFKCHCANSADPMLQLRAEEVELRDRNSVLRTSGGGKINVRIAIIPETEYLFEIRLLDKLIAT